jgi:hypothetical protein
MKNNLSKKSKGVGHGMAKVVESLASKCEALSSNPSTSQKKRIIFWGFFMPLFCI